MYVDILSHKPSRRRLLARSAWSEHVVWRWKQVRPGLLAVAAAIVLALGTIGFQKAYPDLRVMDALYRALQLFSLGATVPNRPNTFLEIARFLAPFVIGYAAIGAIVALYRDQLNRFRIQRQRNHIVVAGLGSGGLRLARAFAKDDWSVVAIERDATNVAIEGCRQRGIRVLVGDAADPHTLRQAGVGRAVLLIAMCGNDGANLDIATASRVISAEHSNQILTALIELDDFELWNVMKSHALIDRDNSSFRLELVNLFASAADLLLETHPPFDLHKPGSPHILVIGDDNVTQNLVAGVLRRWIAADRSDNDTLRITLASEEATSSFEEVLARYPMAKNVPNCTIRPWDIDMVAIGVIENAPADATSIYVAMSRDTQALTVALKLREQVELWSDTPIVIAVDDREAGVGRTVARGGPALEGISAFGWLSDTLRPDALLTHTATETIARKEHEIHCEEQLRGKVSEEDAKRLVPWEQLDHWMRESNRLWADGISSKLAALRCVVTPAPLIDPRHIGFELTDDEVEKLAPLEHERWSADLKHIGFTRGPRDDHHHPLIDVPFDQLPPENQDKDRAHVRSIPLVLARSGFAVHRLDPPSRPGCTPAEMAGASDPS